MPVTGPRTKENRKHRGWHALLALMLIGMAAVVVVYAGSTEMLPAAAEEDMMATTKRGRTVMYVMDDAAMRLRSEDAHMLDQLNVSFALIRNGKADVSHWRGTKKVTEFLKKHPHIDGVLSVGGWGAEGFSDACMTEEGRKTLADSILSLVDQLGFVGVDIDWEYPGVPGTGITSRPEDVENWYALLALLREGLDAREKLHGREYILSVALGAGDAHINAIDPARLNRLLDQAVVMAYDLCGFDRMTGHHAGLYPDQERAGTGARAVQKLLDGGLQADKLLLGMPAYGRVWRQVSGGGDGLGQRADTSGNKTISFDELLRLDEQGYACHYDEAAQAAYWFNGSTFVSGEDDRSIRYKCDWLAEKGLQGAAVWQYTQDDSGAMLAMLSAALTE